MKKPPQQAHFSGIDTPLSISLAEHLTPEEREELLQTIEALNTITSANPDDYQSLEILKDAYWRLGMQPEGLAITRQLADTYLRLGQYSSALLEYEGLLSQQPEAADVKALIEELDQKLNPGKPAGGTAPIALDFDSIQEQAQPAEEQAEVPEPALIATPQTRMPETPGKPEPAPTVDANEPLARFLIQHRLAPMDMVEAALEQIRIQNEAIQADPNHPAVTAGLLGELIRVGIEPEPLLAAIIDRTKLAYAPLEYYDIDRQIVKMLPEDLTLGRRIVPFDIVSRTMMVAIDNPFDAAAKALVQQSVDYHIQWHLAMPGMLHRILRDSYRLPG